MFATHTKLSRCVFDHNFMNEKSLRVETVKEMRDAFGQMIMDDKNFLEDKSKGLDAFKSFTALYFSFQNYALLFTKTDSVSLGLMKRMIELNKDQMMEIRNLETDLLQLTFQVIKKIKTLDRVNDVDRRRFVRDRMNFFVQTNAFFQHEFEWMMMSMFEKKYGDDYYKMLREHKKMGKRLDLIREGDAERRLWILRDLETTMINALFEAFARDDNEAFARNDKTLVDMMKIVDDLKEVNELMKDAFKEFYEAQLHAAQESSTSSSSSKKARYAT